MLKDNIKLQRDFETPCKIYYYGNQISDLLGYQLLLSYHPIYANREIKRKLFGSIFQ